MPEHTAPSPLAVGEYPDFPAVPPGAQRGSALERALARAPSSRLLGDHRQQPFPSKMLLAKPRHPQEQLLSWVYPVLRAQGRITKHRADLGFHLVLPRSSDLSVRGRGFQVFLVCIRSLTLLISTCGAPPPQRQRCLQVCHQMQQFPFRVKCVCV